MAKVETSAGIGAIHGRVGGITFYTRNGQQEMMPSKRSHKIRDKRSVEQMTNRIKTGNVIGVYRYIKNYLDDNFEGVFGGKNKSTFFRKYNYVLRPVLLPRNTNGSELCIVAPYVVSNGKLPTIECEYRDGLFVSNIRIEDLEFSDKTDVGNLAYKIRNHNEYWINNDCLKIILMRQAIDEDTNKIFVPSNSAVKFTLNTNNEELIKNVKPLDSSYNSPKITLINKDGYLAIKAEGNDIFACAFIHTKGAGQTLSASTQSLVLSNTTLYDYYTSEEAATASYTSYKTKGYRNNPKDEWEI